MSKGSAKVWWIIIILIIIIGGIWWWNSSQSATAVAPGVSAATTQTPSTNPADQGLSTSPTDASNAALNQDLNSVDSQMNGLNTDGSAIDQSLTATSSIGQ